MLPVLVATIALMLVAAATLVTLRGTAQARRGRKRLFDYELLAQGFPGAVLVFDRRLRHAAAFGGGVDTMAADPVTRTLHEVFAEDVCAVLEPAYRAAIDGRESLLEVPLGGRDWLISISPVGCGAGLLVATDVTDRKRRERRLAELATRDVLTGVWNRRRLAQELDWLNQTGGAGSLLVLDLDGFKRVNDSLGHASGDELLRRVATAVQGCIRRADLVVRLGGDEFAVLLPGATPAEAQNVAEKIRTAVAAVWPLGIRGSVSVGVSAVGPKAGDAFGRADRAMYADKRRQPQRLAS